MILKNKSAFRLKTWTLLRKVAKPDSRFHWDFSRFIADFHGSRKCTERIRRMEIYRKAKLLFITPDNCLESLREACIRDGKSYLMTPYAIERNIFLLSRRNVPRGKEELSSTLDGAERFAKPMSLGQVKKLGRVDLLLTGASAVNTEGVRYGKGHGFFDVEWAMFRDLGMADESTPIIAVTHDCQVTAQKFPVSENDTIIDYIVTPSGVIRVKTQRKKPRGIDWKLLPAEMFARIPPLQELATMTKNKEARRRLLELS